MCGGDFGAWRSWWDMSLLLHSLLVFFSSSLFVRLVIWGLVTLNLVRDRLKRDLVLHAFHFVESFGVSIFYYLYIIILPFKKKTCVFSVNSKSNIKLELEN
jgi:hypothetical protein